MFHVLRHFSVIVFSGFGFPLKVAHKSVDCSLDLDFITCRTPSNAAVGVVIITPYTARQVILCSLLSTIVLISSYPQPSYHGAICQNGSNYHCVEQMQHCRFQAPRFTKCALTGSEDPAGLIHCILQLCLHQSLDQDESEVSDFRREPQFMTREGWFLWAP